MLFKGNILLISSFLLVLVFFSSITEAATCGDGTCEPDETCITCATDCGICTPTQPRRITVELIDTSTILVGWKAPINDRGHPVTSYKVLFFGDNDEDGYPDNGWIYWVYTDASTFQRKLDNLGRGTTGVRVYAVNEAGEGEASPTSYITIPYAYCGDGTCDKDQGETCSTCATDCGSCAPSQPRRITVELIDTSTILVGWKAPISDSGFSITSYKILWFVDNDANGYADNGWIYWVYTDASTLQRKLDNLGRGTTGVVVYAVNEAGEGEASPTTYVTIPYPYCGDGTCDVADGETCSTCASDCGSCTPSQPRRITVELIDTSTILVGWKAPISDRGRAITSYKILWFVDNDANGYADNGWIYWVYTDASTFQRKLDNLGRGTTGVIVYAVNEAGEGEASPTTYVTIPYPYCGDGTCDTDTNETCITCASDCGSCTPTQPRRITVELIDTSTILVGWKAPINDRGRAITSYKILWFVDNDEDGYADNGWIYWVYTGASTTKRYLDNLGRGTTGVAVYAVSEAGEGEASTTAYITIPLAYCGDGTCDTDTNETCLTCALDCGSCAPTQPRRITVELIDIATILVRWKAPITDHDYPVTSYQVQWFVDNDDDGFSDNGLFHSVVTDSSTTQKYLDNLGRGTTGVFVTAISAAGSSDPSPTSYITLPDVYCGDGICNTDNNETCATCPTDCGLCLPTPPISVTTQLIDSTKIEVQWREPITDRGYPVSSYSLEWFVDNDADGFADNGYYIYVTQFSSETTGQLKDLPLGARIGVKIYAYNEIGVSDSSSSSYIYIPSLYCGDTICSEENNETCSSCPTDCGKCTPTPPRAVTIVLIASRTVMVEWQVPISDRGFPVTSYSVLFDDYSFDNISYYVDVGLETTYPLDNLTPGRSVEVTVFAYNTEGKSIASSSSSIRIPDAKCGDFICDTFINNETCANCPSDCGQCVADAPVFYVVDRTSTSITVNWTSSQRADFYYVLFSDNEVDFSTRYNGTEQTYTITGLEPSTEYFINVGAGNYYGVDYSSEYHGFVTMPTIPAKMEKPTFPRYTRSTIRMHWNLPSTFGGDSLSYYFIQMSSTPADSSSWVNFTAAYYLRNYDFKELTPETTYYFTIAAANSVGMGPSSDVVSFSSAPRICGDGVCDAVIGESCTNCFLDCGACTYPECVSTTNNETCGGHGTCIRGVCNCDPYWFGVACSVNATEKVQVVASNETVGFTIQPSSSSSVQVSFLVQIDSFVEVDASNNVVQKFNMKDYPLKLTANSGKLSDGTSVQTFNYSTEFSNSASFSMLVNLYETATNVEFAGKVVKVTPNGVKYFINIREWPFRSLLNKLQIILSSPSNGTSEDFGTDSSGNIQWVKTSVNGVSLYAKYAENAIIDGAIRTIQYSKGSSSSHTSSIVITVPHFWDSSEIDPDYSVLIDKNPASGGNTGGSSGDDDDDDGADQVDDVAGTIVKTNKSKGAVAAAATLGAVIGVAALVAVVGGVYFYHDKKKREKYLDKAYRNSTVLSSSSASVTETEDQL